MVWAVIQTVFEPLQYWSGIRCKKDRRVMLPLTHLVSSLSFSAYQLSQGRQALSTHVWRWCERCWCFEAGALSKCASQTRIRHHALLASTLHSWGLLSNRSFTHEYNFVCYTLPSCFFHKHTQTLPGYTFSFRLIHTYRYTHMYIYTTFRLTHSSSVSLCSL